jgi:hypothetical protein
MGLPHGPTAILDQSASTPTSRWGCSHTSPIHMPGVTGWTNAALRAGERMCDESGLPRTSP